jgi:hypothetical protein
MIRETSLPGDASMKRPVVLLAALILAGPAVAATATGPQTFQGSFVWTNGDQSQTGKIEAVFTPTATERWDVAFSFLWEGEPRVFKGTAEGSLEFGKLKGRVRDDRKPEHGYIFMGKIKDGRMHGEHSHVDQEGKTVETGTFMLTRVTPETGSNP